MYILQTVISVFALFHLVAALSDPTCQSLSISAKQYNPNDPKPRADTPVHEYVYPFNRKKGNGVGYFHARACVEDIGIIPVFQAFAANMDYYKVVITEQTRQISADITYQHCSLLKLEVRNLKEQKPKLKKDEPIDRLVNFNVDGCVNHNLPLLFKFKVGNKSP